MRVVIFSLRGPTNKNIKGGAREYIQKFAQIVNKVNIPVLIICGMEAGLPRLEFMNDGLIEVNRIQVHNPFMDFIDYYKGISNKSDFIIENMVSYPLFIKNSDLVIIHHLPGIEYLRSQGFLKGMGGLFLEFVCLPLFYRNKNIITVSQFSKEKIVNRGVKEENIGIIPPLVGDLEDFENKRNKNSMRKNIISYIGRFDGPKGVKKIDHVLEILPDIIERYPNLKFIIAGSMKAEGYLKDIVNKLGIQKNVIFLGYITDNQKKEILRASKIFVSPSYQEGFGITFVEANLQGTPVVGYNIRGLDTLPKNAGILVKKDDKYALKEALLFLLNDENWFYYHQGALSNVKRFSHLSIEKKILKVLNLEE